MNEEPQGLLNRLKRFFFHDLWDVEVSSLSGLQGALVRIVRIGHLVVRGVREDEMPIHASSLTFTSLMSLVPLLAIVFALLKGFGFGQDEINKFMEWKIAMPEQFQGFLNQMMDIVNTTNFAALGWIGLAFLLFTAIMVLGSIESSFNRIWGITTSRNFLRRVANYISILVVVPILIGIAGTVTATLRSETIIAHLGSIGSLYRFLLRLSPLFSAWFAFGFLYVFLPNTRVRAHPALISGLVGALLWLAWQKMYISMQIGVARYNAIYGTFASVPIFLAWLYVSWVIVLLGAEVAFAVQNHDTYHMEQRADEASLRSKVMLAFAVVLRAAEGLASEDRPRLELSEFAKERRVPIRLLNEVVDLFVQEGWLAEVAEKPGCYVLLKAPDRIDTRDIVDVVFSRGASPKGLGLDDLGPTVEALAARIDDGLRESFGGQTVQDALRPRA